MVTATAQPQLVVRPSIAATPLGFDRKKAQIFIRDPLDIKVFDWETASLTTLHLPGMQMSETSIDGRLTAFGNMDDGFQVLIMDNETGQSPQHLPAEVVFVPEEITLLVLGLY